MFPNAFPIKQYTLSFITLFIAAICIFNPILGLVTTFFVIFLFFGNKIFAQKKTLFLSCTLFALGLFFFLKQEQLSYATESLYWLSKMPLTLASIGLLAASALIYDKVVHYRLVSILLLILIGLAHTSSALTFIQDDGLIKQHAAKEAVSKTIQSLSGENIESCLTNRSVKEYSCLVYSKRYPIKAMDNNINKILKDFSASNGGSFTWSQRMQLPEGKIEGLPVPITDHDVVDIILGVTGDENSIFLIMDTETLSRINDLKSYSSAMILSLLILLLATIIMSLDRLKSTNSMYTANLISLCSLAIPVSLAGVGVIFVIVTIFAVTVYSPPSFRKQ
jgi:hypothetical protein